MHTVTARIHPQLAHGLRLLLLLGAAACGSESPVLEVQSDVEQCRSNLRAIHLGLVEYKAKHGFPPRSPGVDFLAELVSGGIWKNTPKTAAILTCPGPYAEPVAAGTDYFQLDSLGPASSAYAARNALQHPLADYPVGGRELEAIAACDGAGGRMNHDGVMNVLYADGSILTYVLSELIERGVVPPGTTNLRVGPDSALEDLRKLSE